MFCVNCGKKASEKAIYCSQCGAKIIAESGTKTNKYQNQDNVFSLEDINNGHLFKFLKFAIEEGKYGILIYVFFIMFILYSAADGDTYGFLIFLLISMVTAQVGMNKIGQKLFCAILGANKITRSEHIQQLKTPVELFIEEARAEGLSLPQNIEIYYIKSEQPMAYAVGMNIIVVSEGMAELDEKVFKARIFSELYRINQMDPDYLLFVLGSNFITCLIAIALLIYSKVMMIFGDSRIDFWGNSEKKDGALIFFGLVFLLIVWLGISYLCIKREVRCNVFKADKFVLLFGYGEPLCLFIDEVMPDRLSWRYKLLEFGHPGKDERVAKLQEQGAKYYN